MPYHIATHLQKLGVDVVPLFPPMHTGTKSPLRGFGHHLPSGIRGNARLKAFRSFIENTTTALRNKLKPIDYYAQSMGHAATMGRHVNEQMAQLDEPLDLLFGVCISTPLFAVQTDLPIVYFSDATARLIRETYPIYQQAPDGMKRAGEAFERAAMGRIVAGVFPSEATLSSAVEDYGLSPHKAHLIPMGASVVPEAHDTIYPDMPSRRRLELIIVAADPIRKRLDFCVKVTEILAMRGWNVTLHSIGGSTATARASSRVRVHGALSLGDPIDRDIHKALLRRSHFMLLPSLGEMFGIAPGEAAHFARPSLVSAVGGLPTVVQHGKTGMCLPVDAPPECYADEIERISADENLYQAMSNAALDRAHNVLNWDRCATDVLKILEKAVAEKVQKV